MRPIMSRRNGRTNTRASSTAAGTSSARNRWRGKRSSASFRMTRALTARHAEIPSWDEMPANLKPVLARQMEIYAGFLEQVDHHVGRLVDTLSDLGILDDTLIYYIIGDNGASAEGTINGCFNEMTTLNGMPGHRDARVPAVEDRRFRHAQGLQPLCGRLGARALRALSMDETSRIALGRHPQRHDRPLAERRERQRRDSQPVPPRHRRRQDNS